MKIGIYNVPTGSRINKDCMGGFGLGFGGHLGLFGRLIGSLKRRYVHIPDLDLGYVAARHRDAGDAVAYTEDGAGAFDTVYIHASLQGHDAEMRAAAKLKARGVRVRFTGPVPKFLPDRFAGYETLPEPIWGPEPYPAWEFWPVNRFSYYPSLRHRPVVPVLASMGCLYRCSYCPYQTYYGKWRGREPDDVLREIETMKRRFGARGIIFRDPLFTADRERTATLCRGLTGVEWACETRLENLDEELIDRMAAGGCRAIHVGIESESDAVLALANRSPFPFDRQKRLIGHCDKRGVKVNCFFIFGLLGETEATAEDTIRKAIDLNPNVAEFFVAQPYPGTRLHEQVAGRLFPLPLAAYDGFTELFAHPNFAPGRLSAICTAAYRRFYFRPRYAWAFLRRNARLPGFK